MTVCVVNHGITQSISRRTAVMNPVIKHDVDKPWDCFHREGKCTRAIRAQLSTLSALDIDGVHYLPHALLQGNDTYCLPDDNQ